MTPMQLSTALTKLGFTQTAFAELISHNPRTVRSWINGRLPMPPAIVVLIKLMIKTNTHAGDIS